MVRGANVPADRTLSERWDGLGRNGTLSVDSVELWTVDLPFRAPVATAKGVHRNRPLVLVHLVGQSSDPGKPVEGWGECAALADTNFDGEDVARSLEVLHRHLVPALFERMGDNGHRLPGPSDLGAVRRAAPGARLAFAALEMAVADAHLRAEDLSLAGLLGVEGRVVEPGAVVGTADSVEELLAAVGRLVEQGYTRVKAKIGPGWDVVPVTALSEAFPDLSLQVDANGSYRPGARTDRPGHARPLRPPLHRTAFRPGDLVAHARLAARLTTPVCLDESLDSPASVREALAMGACSVVCVKPARLGGWGGALGRRAVPPVRYPAVDGRHVRVGLRPRDQHRPGCPRGHVLAGGPEPVPDLSGGRPRARRESARRRI